MHESIDESPNFTNICIFRGENAYLWSKLLPQSLKFRGWDRVDGIRRIHSIGHFYAKIQKEKCSATFLYTKETMLWPKKIIPESLKSNCVQTKCNSLLFGIVWSTFSCTSIVQSA
jgi:hypothetical protein